MTEVDTGSPEVLADLEDGVAKITLNRPLRRNAVTSESLRVLAATLHSLEQNDNVGVITVTGAAGAFCSGGDVLNMQQSSASPMSDEELRQSIQKQRVNEEAVTGFLWSMSKPTIAQLSGPAAGAGLSIALACDLRYSDESLMMTTSFARMGLAGDYGIAWFLTRLVGPAKAKELLFFSERIGAEDAVRLGLVNSVFTGDALEGEVRRRALLLAHGPRVAYQCIKVNVNDSVNSTWQDHFDQEVENYFRTKMTRDHREATQAFLEKRDATFLGN